MLISRSIFNVNFIWNHLAMMMTRSCDRTSSLCAMSSLSVHSRMNLFVCCLLLSHALFLLFVLLIVRYFLLD